MIILFYCLHSLASFLFTKRDKPFTYSCEEFFSCILCALHSFTSVSIPILFLCSNKVFFFLLFYYYFILFVFFSILLLPCYIFFSIYHDRIYLPGKRFIFIILLIRPSPPLAAPPQVSYDSLMPYVIHTYTS